ncbi:50S ribosomal protein L25/general stress protein Ctc [Actinoallomurus bryophytorum]|uniref:Large ribosomal subunit protein bL25 n=1 Tax=Actinoallomurus bryophytorum TaxID=1490222 RepID=A0A543CFM6_9ACTN|nr:50S ribosomal protein L25/general stress protein Ctc [Actinoallomurus bryophytorum]TQL95884.1 large subunit ribosomal protein L25 [Actinoallomurus bryophytorum]
MSEVSIAAEPRTEFGKGPARRTRRAGRVPAVLYGHGTDPRHISLPGHELMLALKSANVLLRLQGLDGGEELALPKDVQRDPLKGFLEHVDLIVVTSGEKVTVEVPIQLTGDIAPDGMLDQQLIQVSLEVEATHIPQSVEVSVEGMVVGDAIHAKDLKLPTGATLDAEDDTLVLHVIAAPTAEQMEAELGEGEATEAGAETDGEGAAGEAKSEGDEE